jgi:type VI secretion system protein ImpH
MADPTWLEKDSLIAEISKTPESFAYFQAIRLLALAHGEDFASTADFLERGLAVQTAPSMAFPASELVEAERLFDPKNPSDLNQGDPLYLLTASFFGLYGGASPLPSLYGQTVLDESLDDERATRDFLDLLAAPFYRLHALAYYRDQLAIRLIESAEPQGLSILSGLLGEAESAAPLNFFGQPLSRLSFWARHSRPARGLEALLAGQAGLPAVLETFAPRVVPLPEEARVRLGEALSPRLGQGLLLGEEALDIRTKFNVRLAPQDEAVFLDLLPGGEARSRIDELVAAYAQEPLAYELIVDYRPGAQESLRLGERGYLGRNAFLAPAEGQIVRVYSPTPSAEPFLTFEPGASDLANGLARGLASSEMEAA